MKREKLTMSQALVKFLDNQYIECDGEETKFVSGIFGIFGHGCVVGVGQALEQGGHNLKFYQGKNEQNMALAAVAYAKQMDRKAIIPCVSSIGPGATNMVTACGFLFSGATLLPAASPLPCFSRRSFSIISPELLPMRSRAFAIILTEFCAPSSL